MATKTNPQAEAPRQPTFSLDELNNIIADALAKQAAAFEAALAQKAERKPATNKVDYEALAVKAFRRAGYGEVKLQDRKTYNLWLADGFKVKPGEKSIRVKNLRLFHRSQCEAMTAAEKREALAALKAKTEGKATPQPAPAPKAATAKAKAVPISGGAQTH